MRHGTSGRRSRNRGGNGRKNNQNRAQVFDSNGPEVRIRGTAHQICEKYVALAKDAAATGDKILAESYLQHAEHYQRIISVWQEEGRQRQQEQQEKQAQEEDLSLPASILGAEIENKNEEKSSTDEKSSSANEEVLEDA